MTNVMTTNQMIHRMVDSILEPLWQLLSPPKGLPTGRRAFQRSAPACYTASLSKVRRRRFTMREANRIPSTAPMMPPITKPSGHAQNASTCHVCHTWEEEAFFDIQSI